MNLDAIFTLHARERMERRGISEEEVFDAIKRPDKTRKAEGTYYFQKKLERGMMEVCCEKTENIIKVITVYWV